MPGRPSKRYLDGVAEGRWTQDAGQLAALVALDRVAVELLEHRRAGPLRRLGFKLAGHAGVRMWRSGDRARDDRTACDCFGGRDCEKSAVAQREAAGRGKVVAPEPGSKGEGWGRVGRVCGNGDSGGVASAGWV